jgi:hypothetical protein
VFYNLWQQPEKPADVDGVIAKIKEMKPFQGDDWFDSTGYGETVYFPLHDNTLVKETRPSAENMAQWRRVAQAVADKIEAAFSAPFRIGAAQVTLGVSIGVGVFPDDAQDFEGLLKVADQAMYAVKRQHRMNRKQDG